MYKAVSARHSTSIEEAFDFELHPTQNGHPNAFAQDVVNNRLGPKSYTSLVPTECKVGRMT